MSTVHVYEKERRAIITLLSMSVPQHHASIVEILFHQDLYTNQETTDLILKELEQDGAIVVKDKQYLLTSTGVQMRHIET